MTISKPLLCLLLAVSLGLGACTMAPDYERPMAPVPVNWPAYATKGSPAPGQEGATAQLPQWRDFFKDPVMQALIESALANNRDLRIALLNIERARGQYQIRRADLAPSITAGAANSNELLPADLSPLRSSYISRETGLTVGITSFELDIFGRVRSLKDAALQSYFASEYNAYAAQISLMAEVAAAYLQLAADREQLALARETYQSNAATYRLVSQMFDKGIASQLDVSQAKTAVESARASAASYEAKALRTENALALIVGGPLPQGMKLANNLAEVQCVNDIPAGLPSELLERRPDIMAAEHNLLSANANIGAARANFFPRISLTAGLGTASMDMSKLFTSGQGVWSFAPAITLPIFEGGRNIATLDVSETDKKIAVAGYEKAIQVAFREVADTLAQRSTITEQVSAEAALVRATRQTYDISRSRYDIGLDNFLTVLEAQRSLFAARQSYIYTKLLKETNTITMYKALGGGWDATPNAAAK